MKCIASVAVDLDRSPLGTRSRLADSLDGTPVLRRTVERVLRAEGIESVHVLASIDQGERVRESLRGLPAKIELHRGGLPPYAMLVRTGRWWGLDSWRGGVNGLTVFDEDVDVEILRALAAQEKAEAVISIPAAAALVDPAMLDALIHHFEENKASARMAFVQAPPGLAAILLAADLLDELAPTGQPPGVLLTYHPDRPIADLTGKEACYRAAAEIIEASGRLLADTRRGFDRLRELIEAGAEAWDARRISHWLNKRSLVHVEPVPTEIEIELTTEDALPDTTLRPRGSAVGTRGPIRQGVIQAIMDAVKDYDDVRIVLGGFGEPCLHPAFPEICQSLRRCPSIAAIAVRTSGLFAPDQQRIAESAELALFETPVDVVEVMLDAASAETYRRVHGFDGYEQVIARLDRWIARREERRQVRPLIVPSFIKARENLEDMEAFFDRWQGRLGMAVITGYSHCAGQRPARAVTSMTPPIRGKCRRIFSGAMILADGRMTTCDQDFTGRQVVGVVGQEPFEKLWRSSRLAEIRTSQFHDSPLCQRCDEWHRP